MAKNVVVTRTGRRGYKIVDCWRKKRRVVRQGGQCGHTLSNGGKPFCAWFRAASCTESPDCFIGSGVVVPKPCWANDELNAAGVKTSKPSENRADLPADPALPSRFDQAQKHRAAKAKSASWPVAHHVCFYEDKWHAAPSAPPICCIPENCVKTDAIPLITMSNCNICTMPVSIKAWKTHGGYRKSRCALRRWLPTCPACWTRKQNGENCCFSARRCVAGHRLRHLSLRYPSNSNRAGAVCRRGRRPSNAGIMFWASSLHTTRVGSGLFPTELFDEERRFENATRIRLGNLPRTPLRLVSMPPPWNASIQPTAFPACALPNSM